MFSVMGIPAPCFSVHWNFDLQLTFKSAYQGEKQVNLEDRQLQVKRHVEKTVSKPLYFNS